jgi:hypothetical protein
MGRPEAPESVIRMGHLSSDLCLESRGIASQHAHMQADAYRERACNGRSCVSQTECPPVWAARSKWDGPWRSRNQDANVFMRGRMASVERLALVEVDCCHPRNR